MGQISVSLPFPVFIWKVAAQSFMAALLGSVISAICGYIFAHSLFRLAFNGQKILVSLLALSMVLPSIIAIEALVVVYGHQGLMNQMLMMIGLGKIKFIYNFTGVLIAFTFFNISFFALIFLERLQSIPRSYWHNSAIFNFSYGQDIRYIEWPFLRSQAVYNLFFVFALCFTSFAPVLILGGGKTQTLTVTLYHALARLDMPMVIQAAMMQFIFSALALSLMFFIQKSYFRQEAGFSHHPYPYGRFRFLYGMFILLFSLYILGPFLTILYKGFMQKFWLWLYEPIFYKALLTSLYLAFFSAFLSLFFAFILAKHSSGFFNRFISYLPLMIPSFILMAGLFIFFEGRVNLFSYRRSFIIISSAFFALPLSLGLVRAPLQHIYKSQFLLAQSLNLSVFSWLRYILWPQLRLVYFRSLGIVMAFCFGEFGVIAFLGSQDFKTLPLLLYELMSRRRFGEAESLACLLLIIYMLLFISLNPYKDAQKNAHL